MDDPPQEYANIPFALNLLMIGLLLVLQWQHVGKKRDIFTPGLPQKVMLLERNRSLVVLVITFTGSILAFNRRRNCGLPPHTDYLCPVPEDYRGNELPRGKKAGSMIGGS